MYVKHLKTGYVYVQNNLEVIFVYVSTTWLATKALTVLHVCVSFLWQVCQ